MKFNSGVDAEGCFGEVYLDGHKHIPTPRRSLPAATAEEAAVTKDRTKEIVESSKVREQVANRDRVGGNAALGSLLWGPNEGSKRHVTRQQPRAQVGPDESGGARNKDHAARFSGPTRPGAKRGRCEFLSLTQVMPAP